MKKGIKKKFYIDQVKSAKTQQGPSNLYYFDDNTTITFNDSGTFSLSDDASTIGDEPLSDKYIGGLQNQLQELNTRLKIALQKAGDSNSSSRYRHNPNILIHGFEGTGKTLLLQQLEKCRFGKVFRLQKDHLDAPTTARNKEMIREIFKKARASQPSLLLMDDINEIATSDDKTYSNTLVHELADLSSSRVLVIATCRAPSEANSTFLAKHFPASVELPVPDQGAREQILKTLLDTEVDADGRLANAVSARTHGFTGQDLDVLVEKARAHALLDIGNKPEVSGHKIGSLRVNLDGARDDGAIAQHGDNTATSMRNGEQETAKANGYDSTTDNPAATFPYLNFDHFASVFPKVRPAALREIIFERPKTTWSDIGGSQEIQESFDRIILWPQKYAEDMKLHNMQAEKGVLLYGPPGCSKTLTAQAIATKYGLNFIAIKGGELISMYVGESERSIRELFRKARAAKPCVIFFDEIDSIASTRDNSKGLNVVQTLLTEMDGFNSSEGVLILAATNKPEALDPAIMRPGRFDAHFYLGLPNTIARSEILDIKAKGAPGADTLDYGELAAKTDGYTGAELAKIYGIASGIALQRKIKGAAGITGDAGLTMDDFEIGIGQTKKGVTPAMIEAYAAFGSNAAD